MDIKKLLGIRKKINKIKPNFVAQDTHKNIKLKNKSKWRKPRGRQSKMRLHKRGYRKTVKPGYGSPSAVNALDNSGLMPINVTKIEQLNDFPKDAGAIISSNFGKRKRLQLIEVAKKNNVKILNIKDLDAYVKNVKDELEKRKEIRKDILAKKEKKVKKEEKKESKKEEKKEEKPEDVMVKASEEKKAQDKLLTSKGEK